MYLISNEGYKNAGVHILIIKKSVKIWAIIKNVRGILGVKNISDLILKEIYDVYETKNLTKEQIKKHKMTEREILEKYDNLSEDELNTKSNKNVYVENDVMTTYIKRCRGIRKEAKEKYMDSEKKLMIPESEISECPEFEVKSKIGNIFVNQKILEEYSVTVYKIDPYFYQHYKEKIEVDKNGPNTYYLELTYILLNIF